MQPGDPSFVLRALEPGMMWYSVVQWEILAYEQLSKVSWTVTVLW